MKTNRCRYEFHVSPIWNENHLCSSALSCCGWLASSFDLCLHERIPLEYTWICMNISLFWVLLAFLILTWNDFVYWSKVGLEMMSNLQNFFKSFYFYFFKSFSFYQKISNYSLNLNFIFVLSLILIFNVSTKCMPSIHLNQMTLYSLLVMLLVHIKTKHRFLNHL